MTHFTIQYFNTSRVYLYFVIIDDGQRNECLAELVERLSSQFPYDNGILMVYFLNYLKLEPFEGVFLAANEPHAYLSGGSYLN